MIPMPILSCKCFTLNDVNFATQLVGSHWSQQDLENLVRERMPGEEIRKVHIDDLQCQHDIFEEILMYLFKIVPAEGFQELSI